MPWSWLRHVALNNKLRKNNPVVSKREFGVKSCPDMHFQKRLHGACLDLVQSTETSNKTSTPVFGPIFGPVLWGTFSFFLLCHYSHNFSVCPKCGNTWLAWAVSVKRMHLKLTPSWCHVLTSPMLSTNFFDNVKPSLTLTILQFLLFLFFSFDLTLQNWPVSWFILR